jgi:hypothetical protein
MGISPDEFWTGLSERQAEVMHSILDAEQDVTVEGVIERFGRNATEGWQVFQNFLDSRNDGPTSAQLNLSRMWIDAFKAANVALPASLDDQIFNAGDSKAEFSKVISKLETLGRARGVSLPRKSNWGDNYVAVDEEGDGKAF